jgi:DNA invertase Pin-like site-specific DNA recombinase
MPGHRLYGEELAVHAWHHLGDEIHLLVSLPDGSRGYFPIRWTSVWPPEVNAEPGSPGILTSDAVRELRLLVQALRNRRNRRPSAPHKASRLTAKHDQSLGGKPLARVEDSPDPPATAAYRRYPGGVARRHLGCAATRRSTGSAAAFSPPAHALARPGEAAAVTAADITSAHLARQAVVYVRQSTIEQVTNNLESQRRQYGLVDRAVALGWPRPQVVVIDDDLGVSGSGVAARTGFERLVAEVGLGHVGVVLALEVSRLARNNRDWYHLLDLCALVDTFIADADGLYSPSAFNDRLLLGLKGTMSEVELHLIRSRLNGGLWEAARRGELRTHLPIGYEHDRDGRIVKTADEAIRETIALVFTKFAELGSARQVVAYLAEQGVPLPHRRLSDEQVTWRRVTYPPVHRILVNPIYAGVYAYGQSKQERRLDETRRVRLHVAKRPLLECEVLIHDHHEAYILFDTYQAIQKRLRANWPSPRGEAGGAVRNGPGLLQGLLRCGRCGRRMQVTYSGAGGNVRRYSCHQAQRLQAAERICQSLGGVRLETRLVDAFLAALAPASLEATILALQETECAWGTECRQRELLVEQARYAAERAERQFSRVEPENRLVARTLERAWEERLRQLRQSEDDLARFRSSRPTPLSDDDIQWLRRAGADLKAVWQAPTTTDRDRKHLLRCLISEVIVTVNRERAVADLVVRWAGGASTKLDCKLNRTGGHYRVTSEEVKALLRELAPHYTNDQIAFILNAKHLLTGTGKTFNRQRVAFLRQALELPQPDPTALAAVDGPDWMDVSAAAQALGVSPDTIRRWAQEGYLEARQVMPAAPWRVKVTDEVRARVVPDAPDDWVGLAEAARRLGRAKQTILHWVQSGKLRSVQVTSGKRKGLRIELRRDEIGLFAES